MKPILILIASSAILILACNGYSESSVNPKYISRLADSLSHEQRNGVTWANSPVEIVRHFFPPISHDIGPKLYKVSQESILPSRCRVTIIEEGAIDDEVLGQRHILYFEAVEGIWKIIDLKYALKRRY